MINDFLELVTYNNTMNDMDGKLYNQRMLPILSPGPCDVSITRFDINTNKIPLWVPRCQPSLFDMNFDANGNLYPYFGNKKTLPDLTLQRQDRLKFFDNSLSFALPQMLITEAQTSKVELFNIPAFTRTEFADIGMQEDYPLDFIPSFPPGVGFKINTFTTPANQVAHSGSHVDDSITGLNMLVKGELFAQTSTLLCNSCPTVATNSITGIKEPALATFYTFMTAQNEYYHQIAISFYNGQSRTIYNYGTPVGGHPYGVISCSGMKQTVCLKSDGTVDVFLNDLANLSRVTIPRGNVLGTQGTNYSTSCQINHYEARISSGSPNDVISLGICINDLNNIKCYTLKNSSGSNGTYTPAETFRQTLGIEIYSVKFLLNNCILVAHRLATTNDFYLKLIRVSDGTVLNSDVLGAAYRGKICSSMATWFNHPSNNTFHQKANSSDPLQFRLSIAFTDKTVHVFDIAINALVDANVASTFTNANFTFTKYKIVHCNFEIGNSHIFLNEQVMVFADTANLNTNKVTKVYLNGLTVTTNYHMTSFDYVSNRTMLTSNEDNLPICCIYNSDGTLNTAIKDFPNDLLNYSFITAVYPVFPKLELNNFYTIENVIDGRSYLFKRNYNGKLAPSTSTLQINTSNVSCFKLIGDDIIIGCTNGQVKLIKGLSNFATSVITDLTTTAPKINCVTMDATRSRYFYASDDKIEGRYNDGIQTLVTVPLDKCNSILLTPDGEFLVASRPSGEIIVYTYKLVQVGRFLSNFPIVDMQIQQLTANAKYTEEQMKNNIKITLIGPNKQFQIITFYGKKVLRFLSVYEETFTFQPITAQLYDWDKAYILKYVTDDYVDNFSINYGRPQPWMGRTGDFYQVDTNLQLGIEYTIDGVTYATSRQVKYAHSSFYMDGYLAYAQKCPINFSFEAALDDDYFHQMKFAHFARIMTQAIQDLCFLTVGHLFTPGEKLSFEVYDQKLLLVMPNNTFNYQIRVFCNTHLENIVGFHTIPHEVLPNAHVFVIKTDVMNKFTDNSRWVYPEDYRPTKFFPFKHIVFTSSTLGVKRMLRQNNAIGTNDASLQVVTDFLLYVQTEEDLYDLVLFNATSDDRRINAEIKSEMNQIEIDTYLETGDGKVMKLKLAPETSIGIYLKFIQYE